MRPSPVLLASIATAALGCHGVLGLDDYAFDGPSQSTGTGAGDPCLAADKPDEVLQGELFEDVTLTCDKDWILSGAVRMASGTTITIEPGTTILGAASPAAGMLVIEPGAKIMAVGERDRPIVFTSTRLPAARRAGDWGGLRILGQAFVGASNPDCFGSYGGQLDDDSSGELRFVRVEYAGAGVAECPDNDVDAVAFLGVGRGTVVDSVEAKAAVADAFYIRGGTMQAKHLVVFAEGEDAVDIEASYRGKIQFLVTLLDPSNGTDDAIDGLDVDQTGATAPTEAHIRNATMCGLASPNENHNAVLIRNGATGTFERFVTAGYGAALDVRDNSTLELRDSVFFDLADVGVIEDGGQWTDDDNGFDENSFLGPSWHNRVENVLAQGCFDTTAPVFRAPSPIDDGDTAFLPLDPEGFFEDADYAGAFRDASDDWMTGAWVAFGP